jgi:outer membrane protein assembly factor BamB
MIRSILFLTLAFGSVGVSFAAEPWSTYRGNPQRTACTDDKPGPGAPKVQWVYKSKTHFIGAPVPAGDHLLVSGLSFVNTSTFYALSLDPKAAEREVWKKTTPFLRQTTVSSPGLSAGKIVFGDGEHQANGGTLYSIQPNGKLVWQLPVEGDLVHLEGSPTIVDGKVYLGAGSAGVLCVDLDRLMLDGKEQSPAAVARILADRWAEMQKKYEEAKKKKDPFAMPPNEDDLPKPAPVKLWAQGDKKWHVDAPVAVIGDRVLVASAFLDKEMLGERALMCLDAKTGKELWKAPLRINPWGGPAVQGEVVVVSGSTIGLDPKIIKGARGVVAAFDLASGKPKWQKEVPGGVPSCVALTKDSVVFTATDGRVRSFNLATGALRWFYDAKAPLFAPPAVAGETVYAGDLKGVVHAINLKSGAARWALDLGTAPEVASPGMIYAGPVIHGGKVYVATCNLSGDHVNQPTAVVCIGEK